MCQAESASERRSERTQASAAEHLNFMDKLVTANASARLNGSPAGRDRLGLWLRGNSVVFFLVFGIGKVCHAREIWIAGGKNTWDWESLPHIIIGWVWLMFAIYFFRKQENAPDQRPAK